jgi:hypothetical protein
LGAKIEALEPDQVAARGMDAQTPAAYDRATGSILLNMGLLRKAGSPLADKLLEHEIIHHADIQGARARHAASGSPLPFEEWLKARNQAIIDDLAATPVGRKILLDVYNAYWGAGNKNFQPAIDLSTITLDPRMAPELIRMGAEARRSGQLT